MSALPRIEIARPVALVKSAYEKAIAAPALPDVSDLALRDWYPEVARLALRDIAGHCPAPGLLIQTLVQAASGSVRVYRVSMLFGIADHASAESYAPLEKLRAMDSVRSRIVRALAGDLPWHEASHRAERSGILLKALVEARLNGGNTP